MHRYIDVPYKEKDDAKALGAKWDYRKTKWYVPPHLDIKKFARWKKVVLTVPPEDKLEVQKLGAKLDPSDKKTWYINGKQDVTLFSKWVVDSDDWSGSNFGGDRSIRTPSAIERAINSGSASRITRHKALGEERSKFFVFLDLETTGVPERGQSYKEYTCRIVQISCMLCEGINTLDEKSFEDIVIKSDGFEISNAQFHGISMERSLAEGIEFKDAADKLFGMLYRSGCVMAHNADFDINVLKSELYRYELTEYLEELEKIDVICTMKATKNLVGAVGKTNRLKYPNLKELYRFSTGKELEGHHNSKYDVLNLHEAIQCLVRKEMLTLPSSLQ